MAQPGYNSERQRQILEPIRDTLVEGDWDLHTLRSPDQMTMEIWKDARLQPVCGQLQQEDPDKFVPGRPYLHFRSKRVAPFLIMAGRPIYPPAGSAQAETGTSSARGVSIARNGCWRR